MRDTSSWPIFERGSRNETAPGFGSGGVAAKVTVTDRPDCPEMAGPVTGSPMPEEIAEPQDLMAPLTGSPMPDAEPHDGMAPLTGSPIPEEITVPQDVIGPVTGSPMPEETTESWEMSGPVTASPIPEEMTEPQDLMAPLTGFPMPESEPQEGMAPFTGSPMPDDMTVPPDLMGPVMPSPSPEVITEAIVPPDLMAPVTASPMKPPLKSSPMPEVMTEATEAPDLTAPVTGAIVIPPAVPPDFSGPLTGGPRCEKRKALSPPCAEAVTAARRSERPFSFEPTFSGDTNSASARGTSSSMSKWSWKMRTYSQSSTHLECDWVFLIRTSVMLTYSLSLSAFIIKAAVPLAPFTSTMRSPALT
mmetsp:Transcript_128602/g.274332  ORF Transcript_128602/g.274332 Transcript_128602/m.274332 type:complete len:360 (-) Transcript_128602:392-1471(-)